MEPAHLASQNILSIKEIKQYLRDCGYKYSKRAFKDLHKAVLKEYNNTPLDERCPF